jgi:hypothetical protein
VGRYVRQFEVSITFDDEVITATMEQATQEDLLGFDTSDKLGMLRRFRERMGVAIVDLRGPRDAAGSQVPKEEFLSKAYFSSAVMDLGEKWIERATPQNPPSPGA